MNVQEIILKCRKLSRLSTSSNPNEAALAASRLAELMVKYQIEEIDIDEKERSESNSLNKVDSHLFYSSNRKYHWRMSIAVGCARLFNCIPYWSPSEKSVNYNCSNIHLIGRSDDVQLCRYLYESITKQIESLCSSEWAKYWLETCLLEDDEFEGQPVEDDNPPCTCSGRYNPNCAWEGHLGGVFRQPYRKPAKPVGEPLEHRKAWSASFLLACSSTVKSRLLAKHKAMMSSLPSTSQALIVFKDRYKDSLAYANSLSWSKSKSVPSANSIHGYISGQKSGSKVRIDKEISSNLPLLKG